MERQTLFPPVILPLTTTTTTTTTIKSSSVRFDDVDGTFSTDGWSVTLLVLTSIRLLLTVSLWIYLTYRTLRLKSEAQQHRHLVEAASIWPHQLLLAIIFLSHAVLFLFTCRQTVFTCTAIRFGTGLVYAACFATLLLKLILIMSINKGHHIPQCLQVLLLVLMISIQLAISVQWITLVPTSSVTSGGTCYTSMLEWLSQLIYVIVLLLAATAVAIMTRNVKANHRESLFLGMAVGLNIPILVACIILGTVLVSGSEERCLSYALFISTSVVMFVMFVPKSRQLSAIGDIGFYTEDTPVVKPISELTVHKLYYPVYHHHQGHDRRLPDDASISRKKSIDDVQSNHEPEDSGSDTMSHKDVVVATSTSRVITSNGGGHWYPPLRDSNFRINPLHSTIACHHNRYPISGNLDMSNSNRRHSLIQGSNGTLPASNKRRCLTPPSEEGSTTPSDTSIHDVASQDGSDDIADYHERNVDGVSYTQIASRLPMY